jgi:hypothetical protein
MELMKASSQKSIRRKTNILIRACPVALVVPVTGLLVAGVASVPVTGLLVAGVASVPAIGLLAVGVVVQSILIGASTRVNIRIRGFLAVVISGQSVLAIVLRDLPIRGRVLRVVVDFRSIPVGA